MVREIAVTFLVSAIVLVVVVFSIAFSKIHRSNPVMTKAYPQNLDNHRRYGRKRAAGRAAGIVNQQNRRQAAENAVVLHHKPPNWWYRLAVRGSAHYQKKIDNAENLIQQELKIVHRTGPRMHPKSGNNTGGIRREAMPKRERRRKNGKD